MKTFIQYLIEADYSRFLKKNRNLTDDQRKEINDYFSKENTQAGSEIDWQSRKVSKWDYDDFKDIMTQYKSGRKSLTRTKRVKCPDNLKGLKKNVDYVHVKMNSRDYCAYIPLSYETAKKFNTDKVIGICGEPWCIGHTLTRKYWKDYTKLDGKVPVYVVGNSSKWVVMIKRDNSSYEVWDVQNRHGNHDIPGFNVRKELLDSRKIKLYEQIRDEFLQSRKKITSKKDVDQDEYRAAVLSWERMASDLEAWGRDLEEAYDSYVEDMENIITSTIEEYEEKAEEAEEEAISNAGGGIKHKNYKARVDSFKAIMKAEPQGTGTDPKTGEPVWHIRGTEPSKKARKDDDFKKYYFRDGTGEANREGIPYTRKELQAFIDTFEKKYNDFTPNEADFSERDKYLEIIQRIRDIDSFRDVIDDYNGNEYGDIEWTDDFYEYEEDYDSYYYPNIQRSEYDDYFEFASEYGEDVERSDVWDDIYEILGNGYDIDGSAELEYSGVIHPDQIIENAIERSRRND